MIRMPEPTCQLFLILLIKHYYALMLKLIIYENFESPDLEFWIITYIIIINYCMGGY